MTTDRPSVDRLTSPTVPLREETVATVIGDPSRDESGHGAITNPDTTRKGADAEERRSFRRAMLVGLFVWPAFLVVDQYLGRVVYPGAPLTFFFVLRVLGQCAIIGMYLLSFRKGVSRATLQTANAMVCGLTSIFIAIMGVWFGGLSSPYLHGISLVILILALAVPAPWRDSIRYIAGCVLAYPLVVVVFSRVRPELARDLADPQAFALFTAHYLILGSMGIIAAISGQISFNARQELRNARKLGRYRLEARIGEGGMNEVWLAFDPVLKRNVALKILRSNPDSDPRVLARFEREAQALSRLTSPHTVRIYDYGVSHDGFSFIAMEYLPGKDLQALVRSEGPLSVSRTLQLGVLACRSLAEAHGQGIIHRDIKPANVFVGSTEGGGDALKVLDFGIARLISSEGDATKTQGLRGTPAYMAPECWTGLPADARSDIYSLGGTLYFMLTGQPPFADAPSNDLVRVHLVQPPKAPSTLAASVPPEVDALVLRCLAKEPARRFASVAALEAALTAAGRASTTS